MSKIEGFIDHSLEKYRIARILFLSIFVPFVIVSAYCVIISDFCREEPRQAS